MTDDKMQPKVNDRPEQAEPAQLDQQPQKNPANVGAQPGQRVAPGRRPLFGN